MSEQIDEETPLLLESGKQEPTPLPWFQFSIVVFLQLAEPLTSNVISPFAPQLIRDLGVTHGVETQVGYYVGLLQSLFFVAEACTVLFWSRTSDRVGRKPVLLTGLLGLSISMYALGLSTTFSGVLISRILSGGLNGNIGVMKSMVVEITDSTNIAKAYAYLPLAWNTGGTLGPVIGGWLAQPSQQFPRLFGQSEFFKTHPYFLPCAVPATLAIISVGITYLFLEETVPFPTPILQYLGLKSKPTKGLSKPSALRLSNNKIPQSENQQAVRSAVALQQNSQLPIRSLFTPRVIIAAGNYATLSLVDISFRVIQPLFFSTPVHLGGLGLPLSTIGTLLASFGLLNGAAQALLFARMNKRWGPRNVFLWGLGLSIPAFATFPILSCLVRWQGYSITLWIVVFFQIIMSITMCFCYGAVFIFIASASPNRASIGATNGISQMTVSIMRAIGPAIASSLYSISLEKGYLGGYLVYYVLIGMVGVALYFGTKLPQRVWVD